MKYENLAADIDNALLAGLPFASIREPILELLRQARIALLEQEAELRRMKEERDLACQFLLKKSQRHDPRTCTTRGWQ